MPPQVGSSFALWIRGHFSDPDDDTASNFGIYCERLLRNAGITQPPIRLAAVAELLGIEPRPIFRSQAEAGILDTTHGRIYLHRNDGEIIRTGTSRYVQLRFTYAHELAHAMLYDFSRGPGERVAPQVSDLSEEEVFCNKAAAQLLMPDFLLAQTFPPGVVLSGQLLREAARSYQVSLLTMAVRATQIFEGRLDSTEFHLLSGEISSLRQLGRVVPRCAACFLPSGLLLRKVQFLATHQRINRVHPPGKPDTSWSLVRFFGAPRRERPMHSEVEVELLKCDSRHVVRLTSQHHRLIGCRYVWTDGTIELE